MSTKQLLKNRKAKRKPAFRRQEINHQKMLKDVWRLPRGNHSKRRLNKKPRGKLPSVGYRAPKAIRGFTPLGKREVLISNLSDILSVRPEMDIAVIRSSVGGKKRAEIARAAAEKNIPVKN